MTDADPTCLCGDPKSVHRLGRKGCKALDCGCAAFEAADDAAEKTRVLEVVANVCEDQADRARTELGQQSTSARLRVALEANTQLVMEHAKCVIDANQMRKVRAQRDEALAQRDGARMAADQLIGERDELRGQLTYLAEGRRPAAEIHGWDAWHCLTCGSRYRNSDPTHPHPLTPVRVSITERQEHHP